MSFTQGMNINCNRSLSLELFQALGGLVRAWFSTIGLRRFLSAVLFLLMAAQAQAVTNVSGSISVGTT